MPQRTCQSACHPALTLLELLITIGILGILAALVIGVINPQKQLEDARDAQRRADLNTILSAVYQFQIHEWRLPRQGAGEAIDGTPRDICARPTGQGGICTFLGKAFLAELVELNYLVAIPSDPENTDPNGTGYEIWLGEDGRLYARAPAFHNGEGLTMAK